VRQAGWTEIIHGDPAPDRAILYLHGGGYVAGSAWTHRELLGRLARLTGLRVVAPDYRLAPEHPLPAALEDAVAAWDALLATGLDARRIALAGDSAGGGLALALLAVLCARGTPPGAVVAFSPWTDLTGGGASVRANAAVDPIFPGERMAELIGFTLGDVPAADPRLSPLFADFSGAPPVLIQVGSTEILRDDSTRMAEHLRRFGSEVMLEIWPDCTHVWQMFGLLPEAGAALATAARFLAAHLGPKD
jgi:acetyl esterase/lipase